MSKPTHHTLLIRGGTVIDGTKAPRFVADIGITDGRIAAKSITISVDEKTLYFSSNRPGGFGGLDIYRATKDSKGQWTNVKNLGPSINTEMDDDGPFIDYDGVTLYFSSKGRKGMGGFDVFKTTLDLKTNEWSEPFNLGYPINTPDDDIYIVFSKDGKRAITPRSERTAWATQISI